MKKNFIIFLVLAFLIGSASFAIAGNTVCGSSECKKPQLNMTDEQKSKMISLKMQMLELKKQIIKHNLDNGTITQEQAKKMEERINARLEALKSGKLDQGFHRNHPPKFKR